MENVVSFLVTGWLKFIQMLTWLYVAICTFLKTRFFINFKPDSLIQIDSVHVVLATVLVYIGFDLALPTDTFATAKGYRVFSDIGSENGWALFYVITGCIGYLGKFYKVLKLLSMKVLFVVHTLTAAFIITANPTALAIPAYLVLVFLSILLLWKEQASVYGGVVCEEKKEVFQNISRFESIDDSDYFTQYDLPFQR